MCTGILETVGVNSLLALVFPLSCQLSVTTKHLFDTRSDLLYYHPTVLAAMLQTAKIQPGRCVVSLSVQNFCPSLIYIEILTGVAKLPFTVMVGWQLSPSALIYATHIPTWHKDHASLKKLTNIRDVKRSFNTITIAKDGLLGGQEKQTISPLLSFTKSWMDS